MVERAKAVGQFQEGVTEREVFADQFRNGEYHEEAIPWAGIAATFSTETVCSLVLAVIHHVYASEGISADDPETEQLMGFYDVVRKWASNHLSDTRTIIDSCSRMRAYLLSLTPHPEGVAWRIENIRGLSLVEFAIFRRMGLQTSDLTSAYDSAVEKLVGSAHE
jgi:hypothetical protein